MNLAFVKERFEFELDRMDKLTGEIAWPASVLTALGGAMAGMAMSYAYETGGLSTLFVSCSLSHAAWSGRALVDYVRAYRQTDYRYLPALRALDAFRGRIRNRLRARNASDAEVDAVFDAYLRVTFLRAADENAAVNERRRFYLQRANDALVWVLALTLAAAVPYGLTNGVNSLMKKKDQSEEKRKAMAAGEPWVDYSEYGFDWDPEIPHFEFPLVAHGVRRDFSKEGVGVRYKRPKRSLWSYVFTWMD